MRADEFEKFCKPFDEVYKTVTEKIEEHRGRLTDATSREWLQELIRGFQAQRRAWKWDDEIQAYFGRCGQIESRILRMVVCAYLHISYDLPRELAKEWPSRRERAHRFPENQGEDVYFGLTKIFPEVFKEVKDKWEVMGPLRALTAMGPGSAFEAASHWALHLRTAAWIHARRFAALDPLDRREREKAMLRAMVEALDEVNWRLPWTAGALNPPHRSAGMMPLGAVLPEGGWAIVLIVVGVVLFMLGQRFTATRERFLRVPSRQVAEREVTGDVEMGKEIEFINLFGYTVLLYMDMTVRDPKAFEKFIKVRNLERLKGKEKGGNEEGRDGEEGNGGLPI